MLPLLLAKPGLVKLPILKKKLSSQLQLPKPDLIKPCVHLFAQCTKRGLADYAVIGGASGLDHTKMEVYDSICGLDSNEGNEKYSDFFLVAALRFLL